MQFESRRDSFSSGTEASARKVQNDRGNHPRSPAAWSTTEARLGLLRLGGRWLAAPPRVPTGAPRRVLLVRPDHIGDVLLTAPAVALLRANLPSAHLTYLVGPWSVEAARHGPHVDSLRTLLYPGFTRRANANLLAPYALLLRHALRLRRERFDVAVVFRPDHWWGGLLTLAAGIPVRVGGRTPETQPLLTNSRPAAKGEHAAEQALELARLALQVCGQPTVEPAPQATFRVSEAARAIAANLWQRSAFDGKQVVAIHPNAGAALKSWPVKRWASLSDALIEQGLAVLLVGAPDDGPLLQLIQAHMARTVGGVAQGQTLDASAAIYERSALLVGPDSGAAHLAAAVGTPTLRLYGPAPADVYGPWPPSNDQRVLSAEGLACLPCGHLEAPPCGATTLPACLLALGVDDVLNAVNRELHRG